MYVRLINRQKKYNNNNNKFDATIIYYVMLCLLFIFWTNSLEIIPQQNISKTKVILYSIDNSFLK